MLKIHLLSQFPFVGQQELSGIDDLDRCIGILERHNWDVETAIHDHLGLDPREMTQPVREMPVFPLQNGQPTVHRPLIPQSTPRPQPVDSVFQRIMTYFFNPFLDDNTGFFPFPNQRPYGFTGWLLFLSSLPLRIVMVTFYQFTRFVFRIIRPDNRPGIQIFSLLLSFPSNCVSNSYHRSNRKCYFLHPRVQ